MGKKMGQGDGKGMVLQVQRRMPIGAEILPEGGVHFRVWAPASESVEVVWGTEPEWNRKQPSLCSQTLDPEGDGYFSGCVESLADGVLYKFRLGAGEFPDPASRFQPFGPHGPSQVIDSSKFKWTDGDWKGCGRKGQVIYEMHIGTFTKEGTLASAAREFSELVDTGITILELMPLAEFPGRFGWGYDGVDLFAPTHLYGDPDDLRRFIDQAHAAGLGVILDVVYNHFGPDGNYLGQFSPDYITERYPNEWGDAVNFDGPESVPVREFFISNARYWIEEFHFDGFRFDATHQIFDSSEEHILAAIAREARRSAGERRLFISAENECQHAELVRSPHEKGYGLDAIWGEDFHHTAMVALTRRSEAYFQDYKGAPQELLSAVKWGYLFHGQHFSWQNHGRGTPSFGIDPAQVVFFLQNHDQVANSLRGERLHCLSHPGAYRAMTAVLLLGPGTPLLFQGQEFGASNPFLYFADHNEELAKLVNVGRRNFLCEFPSIANSPEILEEIVPESQETFQACKLDLCERKTHAAQYRLHRDLLRLRKTDPVFSAQTRGGVDGAVLSGEAFLLRYFGKKSGEENGDRLMIVNLGIDLTLAPIPEPLLAPPLGKEWQVLWCSESTEYDGNGMPRLEWGTPMKIPGNCTMVFSSCTPREPDAG